MGYFKRIFLEEPAVLEPSTFGLLGLGALGMLIVLLRKKTA